MVISIQEQSQLIGALELLAEHGLPPSKFTSVFDVGTGPFIDLFVEEILEGLVEPGGSTCRFFEGAYGAGKSHLVQLMEDAALSRNFVVARIDLSQGLNLQDWSTVTRYILSNLVVEIGSDTFRGLPNILNRLGEIPTVNSDVLDISGLPHRGFVSAMSIALKENLSQEAYELLSSYLLGERIYATNLRKVGITSVKNPLTSKNAEQILYTVLGGLHILGLSGTVLLFDENDKTFDVGNIVPYWVRSSANMLRRLIDGCFSQRLIGTAIVFTVLPGFLERCNRVYPALGERIRIVRGGNFRPSWRWPVILIEDVNDTESPDEFLSQAVEKLERVVQTLSGDIEGLKDQLFKAGENVLQANAGSGYRRELMKALAGSALARI